MGVFELFFSHSSFSYELGYYYYYYYYYELSRCNINELKILYEWLKNNNNFMNEIFPKIDFKLYSNVITHNQTNEYI